jgi:hypothetical protein
MSSDGEFASNSNTATRDTTSKPCSLKRTSSVRVAPIAAAVRLGAKSLPSCGEIPLSHSRLSGHVPIGKAVKRPRVAQAPPCGRYGANVPFRCRRSAERATHVPIRLPVRSGGRQSSGRARERRDLSLAFQGAWSHRFDCREPGRQLFDPSRSGVESMRFKRVTGHLGRFGH